MKRLINGETTTPTWSTKKKRKTRTSTRTPQWSPFSSLPDDLVLVIIARVPILLYPILSLVSKSFRSLMASPRLYKVRSLLGHRESRLYVCLNLSPFRNGPTWFTLCRKPDRNNKEEENFMMRKNLSHDYALAKLPMPHSPIAECKNLVAVGSDIYTVGVVDFHKATSSKVSILDCRSHTWREAPSLPVELYTVTASVLDQRIYVAGLYIEEGDVSESLKNSLTVMDIKTQVCEPVPIPCSLAQGKPFASSTCIGGKVKLVAGPRVVAYNPVEGSWEEEDVRGNMCQYMRFDTFCEIDDVLYACTPSGRVLRWYHTEERTWKTLKGVLGELPTLVREDVVKLADYGGKLAVLWNRRCLGLRDNSIWCAVIALERRNTCEIWGNVEWFGCVLNVPPLMSFQKALSATL